ncbi:MAG TPA: redoxin domain-containing protein [Vicinamibacterales bacterium]|nr:redoxin domain-containing protein [Vicinamibacterales bacterium]
MRRHLALTLVTALALAHPPAGSVAQDQSAFAAKMQDAALMLERRQFEDALRIYKDANALQGKKSAAALLGMAHACRGLSEHKKAIDHATEALKYVGDDPELEAAARNVRGLAHFALGGKANDKRWKLAEEDFRAALAASDTQLVARYNLGVALLKQERDEEGVRELQAFLERGPTGPNAAAAKRFVSNPRYARETFAPDFAITTLSGDTLTSESLLGKVVLLDFWATWCGPCVEATPGLARIHKKLQDDDFVIVGVSADRDAGQWRAFIDKNRLGWPQFLDTRQTMASRFGVNAFPTYILIDHEGVIRYRKQGWSPNVDGQIEHEARKLLKVLRAGSTQ